jgi:ATP-dependent Lon protease
MISALTKKPIDRKVAMTGEITLTGRVLPIGGLKEKTLAALRAGMTRVIIPEANARDLDELPQYVKRKIEFIPVKDMDDVVETLFNIKPKKSVARKPLRKGNRERGVLLRER